MQEKTKRGEIIKQKEENGGSIWDRQKIRKIRRGGSRSSTNANG